MGPPKCKSIVFFLSFKIFPNNPPALTVFSLDKQGSIVIRNYAPFCFLNYTGEHTILKLCRDTQLSLYHVGHGATIN